MLARNRLFYLFDFIILTVILVLVAYPLIYILSSSFSDKLAVMAGRVVLWPINPSFEGYIAVFEFDDVWIGYYNTIIYTVFGTALNVVMTMIIAYPLSRRDFVGRNLIMFGFTFTLFFHGGLIPTYLLIRSLGLIDTRAVMIIPWAIMVYNMIITRTFLQSSIPTELYEAARVDGASNIRMLMMIVLPLSGPIIAVIFAVLCRWPLEPVLQRVALSAPQRAEAVATGVAGYPGTEFSRGADRHDGVGVGGGSSKRCSSERFCRV